MTNYFQHAPWEVFLQFAILAGLILCCVGVLFAFVALLDE